MAIEDYILDPIYREDAINKEAIMQLIKDGVLGTNLVQPVDTDPTYRSGFDYARSIAGGMPFEQVVAPGMSFSPDRPMGYTQQDLNFMSFKQYPLCHLHQQRASHLLWKIKCLLHHQHKTTNYIWSRACTRGC